MKKALVLLLILAVAGGIFAQELSWSGEVVAGTLIELGDKVVEPNDKGGVDKIVTAKADDDDGHGMKASLTATYDATDWGLKIGIGTNTGSALNDGMHFTTGNAYGWMNFLGGMINVKAGLIDDAVWGTGGELDDNVSNGPGMRVEVTPIEGLNVGVKFHFATDDHNLGRDKIANWFQETAIGASYGNDMFNFAVGLKLWSEESGFNVPDKTGIIFDKTDPAYDPIKEEKYWDEYYTALDAAWGGKGKLTPYGDTDIKLIFAFGIKPIAPLSILIDGGFYGLGDFSENGKIVVYEEISFQVMDPLSVGILLGEWIHGDSDLGFCELLAKPWVEYALNDQMSVGVGIPIRLAKYADVDETDFTVDYVLGFKSFGMDPWFKYTLGGSYVKLGYGFTFMSENHSGLTNDEGKGKSSLDHYIRILFGYSF